MEIENDNSHLGFGVRILVRHPDLDPSEITKQFGLKPSKFAKSGEKVIPPQAGQMSGTYGFSWWSKSYEIFGERLFFQEAKSILEMLEPSKEFISELRSTRGTAQLIFNLPGERNIGDTLPWEIMAKCVDLKLDIGVEVFPDWELKRK